MYIKENLMAVAIFRLYWSHLAEQLCLKNMENVQIFS